ncbi:MAG: hypothetical protein L6W00_25330 [Lentisphaeria bacterium]|nr:MAG: hypothetical protein L6W00_25330 [Lentisphaeria bacterium]
MLNFEYRRNIMLNPLIVNAAKVLDGAELSRAEALELARSIEGADILDLASLANKVREKFSPRSSPAPSSMPSRASARRTVDSAPSRPIIIPASKPIRCCRRRR